MKTLNLLTLCTCLAASLLVGCTSNRYERTSYDPTTGNPVEVVKATTRTKFTQRAMDKLSAKVTDTNGLSREFLMERYQADPDEAAIKETATGGVNAIKATGSVVKELKNPTPATP